MDNITNDDRLKVLQERLAQIKEKKENPNSQRSQRKDSTEITSTYPTQEKNKKPKNPSWGLEEKKKKSFSWLKNLIIIGGVAYGLFYAYSNLDSLFLTNEVIFEEETPFILKYNLQIEGNQLAIINSFKDENLAKKMVNELTVKGFKCDYFFLPNKSNSTEEIYKVFIGPYESLEEVNQWKRNIKGEVEILNL